MVEIRLPNITAGSDKAQLQQVKSYLYQLAEQLNWAMSTLETTESQIVEAVKKETTSGSETPAETFNSIKALIIKSADIVNAYYEQITERLDGSYVAVSDFGVYQEETSAEFKKTSESMETLYENIQQITSDLEEISDTLIEVTAHTNSGLLYTDDNGIPVYGFEVGQRTEVNGEEVFNKYARFTSDRLSFYDHNDNEVAYFSDKKMYITNAQITGTFQTGGFIDTVRGSGDIVTKWIGV